MFVAVKKEQKKVNKVKRYQRSKKNKCTAFLNEDTLDRHRSLSCNEFQSRGAATKKDLSLRVEFERGI